MLDFVAPSGPSGNGMSTRPPSLAERSLAKPTHRMVQDFDIGKLRGRFTGTPAMLVQCPTFHTAGSRAEFGFACDIQECFIRGSRSRIGKNVRMLSLHALSSASSGTWSFSTVWSIHDPTLTLARCRWCSAKDPPLEFSPFQMFAVFDGHGQYGDHVAQYLARTMPGYLDSAVAHKDPTAIPKAMVKCFL